MTSSARAELNLSGLHPDPAGRSFLLVAEQEQGDTLHFVRYAPMLAALGAHVHLMVQPSLVRLLSGLPGIASVRSLTEPPPVCDACIPLLSLPLVFGTTLATIPAAVPYLHVSQQDRAIWKRRLGGERRRRVGLVWAGSAHDDQFLAHMVDRRRSLPLAALAPLADVPDLTFYSLQKGPPANEVRPPDLDAVALRFLLALAARPIGQPLVSDHAPVPPGSAGRLDTRHRSRPYHPGALGEAAMAAAHQPSWHVRCLWIFVSALRRPPIRACRSRL